MSGALGSEIHLGYPGRPDVQVTSDTEGGEVSVAGGLKTVPGSTSAHRPRSPPVEVDDGGFGVPHGLCTPPSESVSDDREPSHEQGSITDLGLISRAFLARNLPHIPTPRSLTPEPSVGEDQGTFSGTDRGSARQGLQVISEPVSSLTPPSPTPSSLGDDVSGQAVAHKAMEGHTDSLDDEGAAGNAAEGSAGAPMYDSRSSPRTDQEATSSGVPVITLTSGPQSIAVSDGDASQVPREVGDADLSRSPGQPNFDPSYSPTNAYESYFRFSSPMRHLFDSPRPSATPSRYATPSESSYSESRPTTWDGDEDEVLRVLVQGASGVSTPSESFPLPTMFSRQSSLTSSVDPLSTHPSFTCTPASESFGVDPSVLHHDPSLLAPHGHQGQSQTSPRGSNGTLSPLTSLEDVDDDPARQGRNHRSELDRAVVRAASEATVAVDGRAGSSPQERERERVGGPSASLDQLALLARREPLKIYLRLPGAMRGVKRKRDGAGAGIEVPADEVTVSTQAR